MKSRYSTWANALAWTTALSGCASPSFNQQRPVVRDLTVTDQAVVKPTSSYLALSPPVAPSVPRLSSPSIAPAAFSEGEGSTNGLIESDRMSAATPLPLAQPLSDGTVSSSTAIDPAPVPINLPTALAMIGGQHPVVGFARWRVQEAYANLDRAKVMWLPSIQSGFNYRRRDGNYQDVQGAIVDVNLNSFNYGLGAGAVAAGSPTRPGIVAQFHLADAIFLPKTAEKTAWARQHAASAALNQQLLSGAVAYIDLLEAYQDLEIVAEAVRRTDELAKITQDYADAGEGLKSDADRTATELALLQTRQLAARERQMVASTRLARSLSMPMTSALLPQDTFVVPLEMLQESSDEPTLIATGLAVRPELQEAQALVAAACEAYKREKYAPFVPSVLLGFSTTSFGGGLGNHADNFAGRYDIDAMMVWEMRNLGFGEGAARRERNAQIQQATFANLRMMDQVAQEVAEANVQVAMRRQQMEMAQNAIASARDSYQRNIDRIRDGEGLPIEVLQSIQALESAQRAYLNAVANHNRSQLQLQWALGWPVTSPPTVDQVVP